MATNARDRGRGGRPRQGLQGQAGGAGARRGLPPGPVGHGPRAARAERRGQDDGSTHPLDDPAAGQWPSHRPRSRRRQGGRRGATADRAGRAERHGGREPDRAGEPTDGRPADAHAEEGGHGAGDGAARAVRPDGRGEPAAQDLLRRYASPGGPGRRPGRAARRSSSSTSRRPVSTHRAGRTSGWSSRSWWPTGPRSS